MNQVSHYKITDSKFPFLLSLADSALIIGHRNSEWCGHGPILEQDIAITNISLDLLGQARLLYQYAARLAGNGETEDSLAYLRSEREYLNIQLAELPNGDWGQTILRQFFFSTWQYYLYSQLKESADDQLAAIAAKSLKEVTYHLRWSSEWVLRLGDGTPESRERMLAAVGKLWPYTGEMTSPADFEIERGIDFPLLANQWIKNIREIFREAGLPLPETGFMHRGGKEGIHTEHLGYILADLQYMQRAYPGCEW